MTETETPMVTPIAPKTWEPHDTSQPGFAAECRRQSLLVAQVEAADDAFLDAALAELDEPHHSVLAARSGHSAS
ncbi:antitoxin MazE-like protein [Methylobacterium sp. PvR107]|uniref:antitoxin MazE-like protein n=1 Tax=Methylobacterium sp. PvR107 TaxID=2806597 RepID=UPI001AE1475B|nr:antitoxin MazE-like protein [Methylobacterium sp. PvR107]MBP1183897.1 hypothetical protein [Methylobacterium sp. PvR107]